MNLQGLRHTGGQPISFDGSRPLWRVGLYPRVSEFLQALPMLKGDPISGSQPDAGNAAFVMKVTVSRPNVLPTVGYYDNLADITAVYASTVAATDYNVVRLGAKFIVPKLDAVSNAVGTAADGPEARMYACASAVLQRLDTGIARDNTLAPGNGPYVFAGVRILKIPKFIRGE